MMDNKRMRQGKSGEKIGGNLRELIRRWAGWFLVGVILVILVSKLWNAQKEESVVENKINEVLSVAQVRQIDASEYDELARLPEVFVLDVHVPEQNHLSNTDAFIPFDQIEKNVSDLPADKTTPILVYCRSGGMSKQASAELASMGYQSVYDLRGGKNSYNIAKAPIEITPKVKDLGTVVYGEVARTQFELKNNSTHTVEIKRVSTSCSCTKAEISKKSLAPQASAVVNVSFDPAVHKDDQDLGDIKRTIFIETTHPEVSEVEASITARVIK